MNIYLSIAADCSCDQLANKLAPSSRETSRSWAQLHSLSVQLGVSQVSGQAAKVLTTFENKLVETLGPARSANMSLDKPMYPCAAVHAAAKAAGLKVDQAKLAVLSRCKKKELAELVEAMASCQPEASKEAKKKGVTKQLQFVEQIMGMGEEGEEKGGSEGGKGRNKDFVEDFEDDGFEEWKRVLCKKLWTLASKSIRSISDDCVIYL